MILTDSHAHLYLKEFDDDRSGLMERAIQSGISKMFMPNIDSTTIGDLLKTAADYPDNAFAMMGLHPCSVKDNVEEELRIVKTWLDRKPFAAIGETGLDFYWDVTYKEQQITAFNQQIDWALDYDLPIVIHSRNSTPECIDLIRSKQNGKLKGVFHCFSGTLAEAQEIISLGFYLGIGGVVTFKKSSLPEILAQVELNHLLLETDAPYLAPVPFRGKRNESSHLVYIARKIADVKDIAVEDVAEITTENTLNLYKT